MVDVGQPHPRARGLLRGFGRRRVECVDISRAQQLRVHSHTVVLDGDDAVGALVAGGDRDRSTTSRRDAVPHRVLHQGLEGEEGEYHAEHLRGDLQPHVERRAEASTLEREVAVDVAQFVGQHRVLARGAEGIAGEVGEVEDQLACAVRIGSYKRRDGAQRVVDEMRTDLCAQCENLRAVQTSS